MRKFPSGWLYCTQISRRLPEIVFFWFILQSVVQLLPQLRHRKVWLEWESILFGVQPTPAPCGQVWQQLLGVPKEWRSEKKTSLVSRLRDWEEHGACGQFIRRDSSFDWQIHTSKCVEKMKQVVASSFNGWSAESQRCWWRKKECRRTRTYLCDKRFHEERIQSNEGLFSGSMSVCM